MGQKGRVVSTSIFLSALPGCACVPSPTFGIGSISPWLTLGQQRKTGSLVLPEGYVKL